MDRPLTAARYEFVPSRESRYCPASGCETGRSCHCHRRWARAFAPQEPVRMPFPTVQDRTRPARRWRSELACRTQPRYRGAQPAVRRIHAAPVRGRAPGTRGGKPHGRKEICRVGHCPPRIQALTGLKSKGWLAGFQFGYNWQYHAIGSRASRLICRPRTSRALSQRQHRPRGPIRLLAP